MRRDVKLSGISVITGAVIGAALSWYISDYFATTAIAEARDTGVNEERTRWTEAAFKAATQEKVDERAREKCGADVEKLTGEANVLKTRLQSLGAQKDAECARAAAVQNGRIEILENELHALRQEQKGDLLISAFSVAYSQLYDAAQRVQFLAQQSQPGQQAVADAREQVRKALRTFAELREAFREMERAANSDLAALLEEMNGDAERSQPSLSIYDLRGRLDGVLAARKSKEILLRAQIEQLARIAKAS